MLLQNVRLYTSAVLHGTQLELFDTVIKKAYHALGFVSKSFESNVIVIIYNFCTPHHNVL